MDSCLDNNLQTGSNTTKLSDKVMINSPPGTGAKLTHNEQIKEAIPTLAGTIGSVLADPAIDRFSDDDNQFLKFHGIYQQDDRDKRKVAKQYIFMIRGRLPGGVVHPRAVSHVRPPSHAVRQ